MASGRDRRRRYRRGRFGFLYKSLSVVVILIALVAGCLIFFRVSDVVVEGNERYSAEEVTEASGVQKGDSLFTLNKYRVAMRILQQLPYVDEVSIRRALPQRLIISVSENGAAASIESEGTTWLLNYRGKILTAGGADASCAKITGITALRPTVGSDLAVGEEEAGKLASLLELMTALNDEGLMAQVDSIDLDYESRITLSYDERYTIKLPMTTDFAKKVRALRQVLDSERIGESGTIDFTIEEAPHYIPTG